MTDRRLRRATRRLLVILLLASGRQTPAAEPAASPESPRIWGPAEVVRSFCLGVTRTPLGAAGHRIGVQWSGEIFDEVEGHLGGGVWGALEGGAGERVVATGIHFRKTLLRPGPFRFAARGRIGLEDRLRSDHRGVQGVFAAGFESALWLGETKQVALYADREVGSTSGTWNEFGFVVRFATLH